MGKTGQTNVRRKINFVLESRLGYRLEKVGKVSPVAKHRPTATKKSTPADVDSSTLEITRRVTPRTMTSQDKLHGLIEATRYISRHQIEGDIVECGVWRGGSMMAIALALCELGDTTRELHLFDTYDGMSEPTEEDRRMRDGSDARGLLAAVEKDTSTLVWAYATLDDVRKGMESTPYPGEKVHYIEGKVEDTIPEHSPETISLLRLDTDWYASTKHEMEHLYDLLVPGGVIIFDDYGYWEGARKAVDEFIDETGSRLLLNRLGSGRIAVKTDA